MWDALMHVEICCLLHAEIEKIVCGITIKIPPNVKTTPVVRLLPVRKFATRKVMRGVIGIRELAPSLANVAVWKKVSAMKSEDFANGIQPLVSMHAAMYREIVWGVHSTVKTVQIAMSRVLIAEIKYLMI